VGDFPIVIAVGLAKDDVYAAWYAKALIISIIMGASCILMIVLVGMLLRELQRRQVAERVAIRNERRYRLLAENSVDTIVMSGLDGRVGYISPAIKDLLGWAPSEIEGCKIRDFIHPDHLAVLSEVSDDGSSDELGDPRTMTFLARHKSGTWVWLEARVRRLAEDIEGAAYISNVRDVSGRKKAEQALEAANAQLVAMAATDSLTNLSNRRRFDETLDREWRRAMRDQTPLALLLIDADHFKSLNDQYGHQQGDVYLKWIARLIQECIRRPGDMAARYGGEEFAVLLPHTGLVPAHDIAEKIRRCIYDARIPHIIGADGVMTVSIGVYAQTPVDGHQAADLVKRADAALYAAKREGRNRTCLFEGQLLHEN
jgi:diguanylate cyclase (GGDEF)-like protein/PAS domain S-box-containing protein